MLIIHAEQLIYIFILLSCSYCPYVGIKVGEAGRYGLGLPLGLDEVSAGAGVAGLSFLEVSDWCEDERLLWLSYLPEDE
jgi:hypothetical protein